MTRENYPNGRVLLMLCVAVTTNNNNRGVVPRCFSKDQFLDTKPFVSAYKAFGWIHYPLRLR